MSWQTVIEQSHAAADENRRLEAERLRLEKKRLDELRWAAVIAAMVGI